MEYDKVQYDGRNGTEVMLFARASEYEEEFLGDGIILTTPQGKIELSIGDYLFKNEHGQLVLGNPA